MKRPSHCRRGRGAAGFQLIELMIALAILGITAAIAVPGYRGYQDRVNNARAVVGINTIVHKIEQFYADNMRFPDNLGEIGMAAFTDPWGNPFVYQRIYGAGLMGVGAVRKDRNLHPINTDYDLLSCGKNGRTNTQIASAPSADDIIRANNGKFLGLARDY